MKRTSLKIAVFIPTLCVLVAGVIATVITVGMASSASTYRLTDELIDATVNEYVNKFEAISNNGYAAVHALAPMVDSIRHTSNNPREDIVNILKETLASDQTLLALWTCWEPDAFDGKDSAFKNANAYHDSTGRYVPYVYREGSTIGTEPLEAYDDPVEGLFYQGAKNSGRPYITDPYPYNVGGTTINIYSIAIPIMENGKAVGVMGMDISLEKISDLMNRASILSDGYMCVFSPNGIVTTHRDKSLVLQHYSVAWLGNYAAQIDSVLQNGGSFDTMGYSDVSNTRVNLLASGVKIGDTQGYWAVLGFVPDKTVRAASSDLIWLVSGVGLALVVFTGLTIFLLIGNGLKKCRLSHPLPNG